MFRSPKDISVKTKEIVNKKVVEDGHCCDICGEGPWTSELDVEIHRKNQHKYDLLKALKDDKIAMCSICLRVQKDRQTLIEHILVTHYCCAPNATRINREIFICDHCERLFFNKQLLIIHIYHWHTVKTADARQIQFDCPKCWKNIRGKSAWFHLLYHGTFNIGTCPICLKSCENQTEMLEHLKVHPGLFKCNICSYETTKECFFNNHSLKHKKGIVIDDNKDFLKYFLPQPMFPSLANRMTHIFKGIPLASEVAVCILCRALCLTDEDMRLHIYGEHVPEAKNEAKTYQCECGETFFNNVLLKHHIFKLKGDHRVYDSTTPAKTKDEQVVYQIFEISEPMSVGINEIIITGLPDENDVVISQTNADLDIIRDFEEMES